MKKLICVLIIAIFAFALVSCTENYSKNYYEEISTFVRESNGIVPPLKDVEYYFYDTVNSENTNDYYGYYYTKNDEKLSCAQDKMILPSTYTEEDDGYYFGKVGDKSDWSFVKKIAENWYYFEVHDYIYN